MDINKLWLGYDLNSKKQNSRCLSVNTILEGKYLVGPVLGQGGFGITYVGYDLNMESRIAIKEYFPVELVSRDTTTIHGDHVLSLSGEKSIAYKTGLKKYVAEAQNVSQFSEVPGVVSVKDFFYANETAYIVMEFIDGISLKDYLKEKGGRLTEEETLAIMKPILEALVQVHKSGIIHRDISPDNIMLVRNAAGQIIQVKLIDFGAARMTEKNDQRSLTIILKHGYAPEEQYRTHGEQGPWTDVYALCAVFYRMLTGETSVPAMDRLFKDDLKSFEQCNVKVSANTAAAILKGLAVKKDDRIRSVQDLIEVLYEGGKLKSGASADHKNTKAWLIAVICTLAAVAGVVSFSVFGGKSEENKEVINTTEAFKESFVEEKLPSESQVVSEEINRVETPSGEIILVEDIEEDVLGEQIAFYNPQYAISNGHAHTVICKPDGSVAARGNNIHGQCNVTDWTHMVAVQCGDYHSLGLRSDGTVYATGKNTYGQCDVSHWSNVVQIYATEYNSFGLTKDGNILIAGTEETLGAEAIQNIVGWTNIKSITSWGKGGLAGLRLIGLRNDGVVLMEGTQAERVDGRYTAERTTFQKEFQINGWEKVETILSCGWALVGLEKDGTVHAMDLFSEQEALAIGLDPEHDIQAKDFAEMDGFIQIATPYLGGVTVDGTIESYVWYYQDKEWNTWTDLVAFKIVSSGQAIGVQTDGTILEDYDRSRCNSLEEFTDLRWVQFVPYGESLGLVGQKKDGTGLYYGNYDIIDDMNRALAPGEELSTVIILSPDDVVYALEDGRVGVTSFREEEIWEEWLHGVPDTNVKQLEELNGDVYYCVMEDGTVIVSKPNNSFGEEYKNGLGAWDNIKEICGCQPVWALKEDGTVLAHDYREEYVAAEGMADICGAEVACLGIKKDDGTAQVIDVMLDDVNGCTQVDGWSNLVQIEMSDSHTVGLKSDGTVVAVGSNHCGQCEVEDWKDVVYIDACNQCTIGITKDGNLLVAGSFY